jgi:hypothetical protein
MVRAGAGGGESNELIVVENILPDLSDKRVR